MENSMQIFSHAPFFGNLTACHSMALFSAFFEDPGLLELEAFEALTTVPFGLVFVDGDLNRLLAPVHDPDLGIGRACAALQLPLQEAWWGRDSSDRDPLELLGQWLQEGPVVLGPLNMDGMPYLFERRILQGCDHYVVVWAKDHNGWWLADNERSVSECIDTTSLVDAWRADRIPEGRGGFTMRRILNKAQPMVSRQGLARALDWAKENILHARSLPTGGSRAYKTLGDRLSTGWTPSLRRAMSYSIPIRMQRIQQQLRFLAELSAHKLIPKKASEPLESVLRYKNRCLSQALCELRKGPPLALGALGTLHHEINHHWLHLEVKHALWF